MSPLLLWLVISFAWVGITGDPSLPNIVLGFVLGYGALWILRRNTGTSGYIRRIRRIVVLVAIILYEIVASAVRVAVTVLSPRMRITPGIVSYNLKLEDGAAITLLANVITLTPGTLSMDISSDQKTLFIHVMHLEDVDAVRASIHDMFEKRILEIWQ